MGIVRWRHPGLGKFAIYDSNGTAGAADDPNAPRNAPFINPAAHLDKIYLHSDLDLMEASHGPASTTVNHPLVAAGSGPSGEFGINRTMFYSNVVTDHVLLSHGLGYIPDCLVILDDDIVYPGQAIQVLDDGRTRKVAVIVTTTQIILREWSIRTSLTIPAINRTYTIVVFRQPRAASGSVAWFRDVLTGLVEAAFGKFRSDRRYLSVVAGGSPYGFSKGRTIDLANGAARYVDPDGSMSHPVPADYAMKVIFEMEPNNAAFGPSMAYSGSFAGAPAALVQVP